MPPVENRRAQIVHPEPDQRRCRSTLPTTIRRRRGAFATPRCRISMTSTRWRDTCCASRRRRGRGAGMLSARAKTFRQLSRTGDEAMAAGDPAQCLRAEFRAAREFAHRRRRRSADSATQTPLWREAQETPETQMLRQRDASAIRRLVTALEEPFRETFVLREIHNLSIARSRHRRCARSAP